MNFLLFALFLAIRLIENLALFLVAECLLCKLFIRLQNPIHLKNIPTYIWLDMCNILIECLLSGTEIW